MQVRMPNTQIISPDTPDLLAQAAKGAALQAAARVVLDATGVPQQGPKGSAADGRMATVPRVRKRAGSSWRWLTVGAIQFSSMAKPGLAVAPDDRAHAVANAGMAMRAVPAMTTAGMAPRNVKICRDCKPAPPVNSLMR